MKQMGMDPKQMEGGPDEEIGRCALKCGFLEDVHLSVGLCGQRYVFNQI